MACCKDILDNVRLAGFVWIVELRVVYNISSIVLIWML